MRVLHLMRVLGGSRPCGRRLSDVFRADPCPQEWPEATAAERGDGVCEAALHTYMAEGELYDRREVTDFDSGNAGPAGPLNTPWKQFLQQYRA